MSEHVKPKMHCYGTSSSHQQDNKPTLHHPFQLAQWAGQNFISQIQSAQGPLQDKSCSSIKLTLAVHTLLESCSCSADRLAGQTRPPATVLPPTEPEGLSPCNVSSPLASRESLQRDVSKDCGKQCKCRELFFQLVVSLSDFFGTGDKRSCYSTVEQVLH